MPHKPPPHTTQAATSADLEWGSDSLSRIYKAMTPGQEDADIFFPKEDIIKTGNQYKLVSKSSGKNLGTYDTKAAAKKRERQVQYFKRQENTDIKESYLTEFGDRPYSWRMTVSQSDHYQAQFTIPETGMVYKVSMWATKWPKPKPRRPDGSVRPSPPPLPVQWEFGFGLWKAADHAWNSPVPGVDDVVGKTGVAIPVFATVVAIFKEMVKRAKPLSIVYSAKGASRARLYTRFTRMIQRIVPGYKGVEVKPGSYEVRHSRYANMVKMGIVPEEHTMNIPSFREYLHESQTTITEGWLSNVFAWVRKRIAGLFNKLKFGRSVSIRIPTSPIVEGKGGGQKALVGYYAEAVTARVLAEHIKSANGRLTAGSMPDIFARSGQARLRDPRLAGAAAEIARADAGGAALGAQIWNDIRIESEDFGLLTFDIALTGESAKGVSKSDIVLTVTKDSESTVIDRIAASLKVYKTPQINLANTSFISLIRILFYGANHPKSKTEDFVAEFVKKYGARADIEMLLHHQQTIGREIGLGKTKEQARKIAKLTHPEVIDIIVRIFNANYKGRDKKRINARFLSLLGWEGDDEFYAAIGKGDKQKVMSSRKSKALKEMLAKLRENFVIDIKRNSNTSNALVTLSTNRGVVIITGTMTFADSGGKTAPGKTNLFVNLSKMF